jgi:hypothetical protein
VKIRRSEQAADIALISLGVNNHWSSKKKQRLRGGNIRIIFIYLDILPMRKTTTTYFSI